jgi:hypothetical protein
VTVILSPAPRRENGRSSPVDSKKVSDPLANLSGEHFIPERDGSFSVSRRVRPNIPGLDDRRRRLPCCVERRIAPLNLRKAERKSFNRKRRVTRGASGVHAANQQVRKCDPVKFNHGPAGTRLSQSEDRRLNVGASGAFSVKKRCRLVEQLRYGKLREKGRNAGLIVAA